MMKTDNSGVGVETQGLENGILTNKGENNGHSPTTEKDSRVGNRGLGKITRSLIGQRVFIGNISIEKRKRLRLLPEDLERSRLIVGIRPGGMVAVQATMQTIVVSGSLLRRA